MFQLQRKIKIRWSSNFAYAIGLITADGCLHKDGLHISFVSKETKLIDSFKTALGLNNKTIKNFSQDRSRYWWVVGFGDKVFYQFLNSIGLTPAKSKTLKSVNVPNDFFADFLRGLFDGDGTFYTFQDKRWPNSFGFRLSFASASRDFIGWLQEKLAHFYDVKGFIKTGKGVLNLDYTKGDSRRLVNAMYYKNNLLRLERKYNNIKHILILDEKFGIKSLQKQRKPR